MQHHGNQPTMLDGWVDEVGRIGGEGTAVTRFAWSPELLSACTWLRDALRGMGLSATIDAAGNVIGAWESGDGPAVLVGSHLDTVPNGGRFDGALGVLSGLEAIRRLRAEGFTPDRPIWLAAFNDEEGSRFGTSMFGSRAFVGDDLSGLRDRAGVDDLTVAEAMTRAGFDFAAVPQARGIDRVGTYLELHIEQGPRMAATGLDVGVVSGIVGMLGHRVQLRGTSNHAGTTPMSHRHDALAGASRVVLALRDAALARDGVTANVGRIAVEPAGANVVPGACTFTVDIRAADTAGMADVDRLVRDTVAAAADAEGLEATVTETHQHAPVGLDERLRGVLAEETTAADLRWDHLASGAGHDAQVLARHVPAAMLFVPSRDGVSHAPEEYTPPEQREPGVRVLTSALRRLAGSG